jgi:Flp pilus assembly protein TadD
MATRHSLYLCLALGAAGLAAPVLAQQDPAAVLDQLSDAATGIGPGTDLARQQMRSGDLTGAAATLERVLINHPDAGEVLLLHASVLCRLDDAEGARLEIDEARGRSMPGQAWSEASAACGPIGRPGRGG